MGSTARLIASTEPFDEVCTSGVHNGLTSAEALEPRADIGGLLRRALGIDHTGR